MLVVSLTSVPPRFGRLPRTLASLLEQTRPADRIVVNVPRRYRRFPDHDGALPEVPVGVERRLVAHDLGPATKLVPTLAELGAGDRLIHCDDDCLYTPDWIARLLAAERAHPGAAITGSGFDVELLGLSPRRPRPGPRVQRHPPRERLRQAGGAALHLPPGARPDAPPRAQAGRSGYVDIAQGFAGVLLRPDRLPARPRLPQCCRGVDDVWISALLAHAGVPVWQADPVRRACRALADPPAPLQRELGAGASRATANAACAARMRVSLGVWR